MKDTFENQLKTNTGFTLLEILVVLSIITVLIGVSIGVYGSLRNRSALDVDAQKIVSALRLARNRTLASQNTSSHGVHFETSDDSFTNFEGSTYNPADPNNKTVFLNSRIEFLNIQLLGSAPDSIFSRLSGQTLQDGFIEIADTSDSTETRIICIETSGAVRILNPKDTSASCNAPILEYKDGLTDVDLASFPSSTRLGDPAQSFTVGASDIYVSGIDLYIRRSGTPSDIFLEIRKNESTGPTGTVIGKSLLREGAILPVSLAWVRFEFPNSVQLTASTQYFMRLGSLPSSTIASTASGTLIWGYEHSAVSPPAYSGGDAWRFVGAFNNPAYQGEQLGPSDQYDFSFRIFSQEAPTNIDSRNLEFNLTSTSSLRNVVTIALSFDGGSVTQDIPVSAFMNVDSTEFDWSGTNSVGGNDQVLRIHSLYIDDNDTILHVHRGGDSNNVALDINLDTADLVTYTASGVPTKGSNINSMIYR